MLGSLDGGLVAVGELPVNLTGDRVSGSFGKLAFDLGADPKIFELIDWRHRCNSRTGGTTSLAAQISSSGIGQSLTWLSFLAAVPGKLANIIYSMRPRPDVIVASG